MYRVLIVDNDRGCIDRLAAALSRPNYRVTGVSSGGDALRHLGVEETDVVIAEVHLPDIPAWELVEKIHRIDPNIPVIAITADDSWDTAKRVRASGEPVFFYGLKPLNVKEMQQVVYYALRWRLSLLASNPGLFEPGGDVRFGEKATWNYNR